MKTALICSVVSIMGFAVGANAVPIIFTHHGVGGSGTLNGVGFSNADFTITAHGDTDNRQSFAGAFFIEHDFASIDIAGVGTFDFITGTRTFNNPASSTPGFSRIVGADLYNGPTNAAFATWDMLSSIGPINGSMGITFSWQDSDVMTNAGILVFNPGEVNGFFQAAVVPEPATLSLFGLGLAGAGVTRLRKRKAR